MPITIMPYDPKWAAQFAHEAGLLREQLGDYVERIEHMGSTAIPGLVAKPIIDIMIGVQSLEIADKHCIQPIIDLGYIYVKKHETAMPFRRYFQKIDDNAIESRGHSHHIHLVEIESDFRETQLLFRDYLRAHPVDRDAYGALKRDLVSKYDANPDYTNAKGDFIQSINQKARCWRDSQNTTDEG